MATYYVDDGGSATSPFDTWAKAATSLSALDDAITFAHGDIIYIGHDHVCQYTHAASRAITGPSSSGGGVGVFIISATTGSDPPTYAAGTSAQVDTTEGNYFLDLDGSFSLHGLRLQSGGSLRLIGPTNGKQHHFNCRYVLPAGGTASLGNSPASGEHLIENCVVDLTNDGTTSRTGAAINFGSGNRVRVEGMTFVNAAYRTAIVVGSGAGASVEFAGCDFSGFTNAAVPELVQSAAPGYFVFTNCLFPSTFDYGTGSNQAALVQIYNSGSADSATNLAIFSGFGSLISSASIYRTGGATVEGEACSWLITTSTSSSESRAFYTPWMYGLVSSTGSKTFDVYITNDTADFTDAEVWLEVEYLATADEAQYALAKDQRATITTTPQAQTDDTTSTWNGTGPSFTYKQKLSVTATVNETGQYRARVCVGPTSIASSRHFYIDPKVNVT